MMNRFLSLVTAFLTVLSLHNTVYAAASLEITYPWVREAPPTSQVLAAYMTIKNPGDTSITLNSISSPDFETAEVHRTVIENGMARMLRVGQLDIAAHESIQLEPGGLHLMLINPQRALTAGDNITLMIHLSNGSCVTISTPVIRQAGGNHSQHNH